MTDKIIKKTFTKFSGNNACTKCQLSNSDLQPVVLYETFGIAVCANCLVGYHWRTIDQYFDQMVSEQEVFFQKLVNENQKNTEDFVASLKAEVESKTEELVAIVSKIRKQLDQKKLVISKLRKELNNARR